MEKFTGVVIGNIVSSVLYLGVYITGIIVSFSRRRTYPKVFYLTFCAFSLLVILRVSLSLLNILTYLGLLNIYYLLESPLGSFLALDLPIISGIITAVAYALLLVAVFIDREETGDGAHGKSAS
jgi:hypothetical protein